jgi:WD repeat-containing protein 35
MIFWNMKSKTRVTKYVKNLLDITSSGSFCMISAQINENEYILILSNSIGSPVDNRLINFKPAWMCMNSTHAIVANKNYVYVWQFRNFTGIDNPLPSGNPNTNILAPLANAAKIDLLKKRMMKEFAFFVDDTVNINDVYNFEKFQANKVSTDQVSCIFVNENFLLLSCESGKILRYPLPHFGPPDQILTGVKYIKVGSSPNANIIWGIDEMNLISLWDIEKSKVTGKRLKPFKLDFEKKDVWNVLWSEDEPFKFALLEKNRLNIIKDLETEEILSCNGYLAECGKLEITTVMLDDLMVKPWDHSFSGEDIVIKFETRILRDLREMMNSNIDPNEIYQFIERNSNRKLWEMFSKYSMLNLDFVSAEKSMLHYNDYLGLTFIKRVKSIDDDTLKRAEIHQFFLDYDTAEEIYLQADRKDLIISMRIKLGHWDKVIQLIKESGYIQEDNIRMAYNNLAQQYVDKKEYNKAEELYLMTNNYEALLDLYFKTEDFEKAMKYVDHIPENSDFLLYLGEKFESVSLY